MRTIEYTWIVTTFSQILYSYTHPNRNYYRSTGKHVRCVSLCNSGFHYECVFHNWVHLQPFHRLTEISERCKRCIHSSSLDLPTGDASVDKRNLNLGFTVIQRVQVWVSGSRNCIFPTGYLHWELMPYIRKPWNWCQSFVFRCTHLWVEWLSFHHLPEGVEDKQKNKKRRVKIKAERRKIESTARNPQFNPLSLVVLCD